MCVGEQDTRNVSAKSEGKQTMDSLYPGLWFGSGLSTLSPCDPSLLCWEAIGGRNGGVFQFTGETLAPLFLSPKHEVKKGLHSQWTPMVMSQHRPKAMRSCNPGTKLWASQNLPLCKVILSDVCYKKQLTHLDSATWEQPWPKNIKWKFAKTNQFLSCKFRKVYYYKSLSPYFQHLCKKPGTPVTQTGNWGGKSVTGACWSTSLAKPMVSQSRWETCLERVRWRL